LTGSLRIEELRIALALLGGSLFIVGAKGCC